MKRSCMWDPITMREASLHEAFHPCARPTYMPQHLPTHIPPITRLLHSHCYILFFQISYTSAVSVQKYTNFLPAENLHTPLCSLLFYSYIACSFLDCMTSQSTLTSSLLLNPSLFYTCVHLSTHHSQNQHFWWFWVLKCLRSSAMAKSPFCLSIFLW